LVHPDDPCVRLFVDGLSEADLAEPLVAEDRAQDGWVDAGRHRDELPDVIDGDLAALAADHCGQRPAAFEEFVVAHLEDVELALFDGSTLKRVH
jgi:hypothetical protein